MERRRVDLLEQRADGLWSHVFTAHRGLLSVQQVIPIDRLPNARVRDAIVTDTLEYMADLLDKAETEGA